MYIEDLNNTVAWVKLTYRDSSCRILKATRSLEAIEFYNKDLIDRDIYDFENRTLKSGYLFDINNLSIVDVADDVDIEVSKSKPKFDREVDKYASSFI